MSKFVAEYHQMYQYYAVCTLRAKEIRTNKSQAFGGACHVAFCFELSQNAMFVQLSECAPPKLDL